MTGSSDILGEPDRVRRVRVAVDWLPAERERRIATREEMIAAGARVLARHGQGRHRKPETRKNWLHLLAETFSAWLPALRVCLLLIAGAVVLAGVVLMASPEVGAAIGTFVGIASLVGAAALRPRRAPSHRC
ncbi:hypothetical protein [Amycolatopsis jiangsuensis]|uniref:Uncharacterized protein n=1 Tax=Amycolatopsis jiangsuensis TaxID=1181879 RepID=A0A840ILC4_9PSEU|nr:hypothetical protein [Amycolatopsis jiangsuensis]MBB4683106.1 hypothetical protein [Amycolatopsis jiangsuensis]